MGIDQNDPRSCPEWQRLNGLAERARAVDVDAIRGILAKSPRPVGRERLQEQMQNRTGLAVFEEQLTGALAYLFRRKEITSEPSRGFRLTSKREREYLAASKYRSSRARTETAQRDQVNQARERGNERPDVQ